MNAEFGRSHFGMKTGIDGEAGQVIGESRNAAINENEAGSGRGAAQTNHSCLFVSIEGFDFARASRHADKEI